MKGYNGSNTTESIRDLWQTPEFVFNYYHDRFDFVIDLAASKENSLCEVYVSEENNSLDDQAFASEFMFTDFIRNIGAAGWLNPPYSDLNPWVDMAIRRSREINSVIVMLVPADTSVKWFKKAFDNCSECHFISGRLAFINAETQKPVSGNNKGSVVFIFDPKSPFKSQTCLIDRDGMK